MRSLEICTQRIFNNLIRASSVQRRESRMQSPRSSVQSLASRVQEFCYASYNIHQMRSYYFFIIEIVVESANLIQMSKIENYYHHDGEQLLFSKKNIYIYQNTEQKEGCSCNLYIIVRNKEFQFIWQELHPRRRQMPYSTWRKLT